jgi:hypothetical protein
MVVRIFGPNRDDVAGDWNVSIISIGKEQRVIGLRMQETASRCGG